MLGFLTARQAGLDDPTGTNLGEKNRVGHVRFQNKKYRNLVLFSRLKAGSL